jgi:hypothetical protein
MLPLLPLYASNLISHDHGTKADPGQSSTHFVAAIFWYAQLEVEVDTGRFADHGD